MEKDTRSYNSKSGIVAKQFLLPSVPTIFLYLLISVMILLLWNLRTIWRQLSNGVIIHGGDISALQSSWLERTLTDLGHSRIAQFVFWALAGCLVYICVWFIINVVTNLRNDIVADEYVHPVNYSHLGYWRSIIAHKIFLVAVIITFIGTIVASIKITPALAKITYASLQYFRLEHSLITVFGSIIGLAFLVYVLILLAHMSISCWRSVYGDL